MKNTTVKLIDLTFLDQILNLTKDLNPDLPFSDLKQRVISMFEFEHYNCFGLFENDKLVGVSSGWITVRIYSGRQLEIDNLIIDSTIHSKGYGEFFINEIEAWSKKNDCVTVELNTYIKNERSHKFYFNRGYKILGFHFQKNIE